MDRYAFQSNQSDAVKKREAYKSFITAVLTKIYKDFNVAANNVDAGAILDAQVKMMDATQSLLQRRNDSRIAEMTLKKLIDAKKWYKVRRIYRKNDFTAAVFMLLAVKQM